MFKKIHLIVLVSAFSCGSPSEYINKDGHLEKHEVVNGKWQGPGTKYFVSGQLAATGHWQNGKMHGEFKEYFDNGKLSMETTYVDGVEQGLRKTYFETGELSATRELSKGMTNGFYTKYFKSGQNENTVELKNDQLNGKAIIYTSNGDTVAIQTGFNGKILETEEFYESGNTRIKRRLVDSIYNVHKEYYPSGAHKEYRYLVGDTMIYQKIFDEQGQITGMLLPIQFDLKSEELCIGLEHSIIPTDSLILQVNLVNSIEAPMTSSQIELTKQEKGLKVCIPTSQIEKPIIRGYICEILEPGMNENGCYPFAFDMTNNKKLIWHEQTGN